MDVAPITWLREILVADGKGRDTAAMQVSYDNGIMKPARFFAVTDEDTQQATDLYAAWGGSRPAGYRVGTMVRGPGIPRAKSIKLWRTNG